MKKMKKTGRNPSGTRSRHGMLLLLSLAILSGGAVAAGAEASRERTVTVHTRVMKWGQMPVRFEIRGQQLPEGITAADFTISGEATGWGATSRHPFTCAVREVVREQDGWSLVPELFPDKYFYVRALSVTCEKAPELGFTMADIGETLTETADLFTMKEAENRMIKAWMYRPEAPSRLPVVVVFHGYGDTSNLLTYRTAVDWAEPEHQAVRPCIVIAPVIEDAFYTADGIRSRVFAQVLDWIDELAAAGEADPDRIYLMGNSFGGMSSIEMAEQFPDRIAAVLALCPALNYSRTGMANLSQMKDIPLYIAQAERDETIPSSVGKQAAEKFAEAGGDVILKIYSDAEMEAAGAAYGSGQTYSFHHAELALLEDDAYAEWLFSHVKNAK